MTTVRVRGIYATALTAALADAGHEVVDPSDPIRDRFDREFRRAEPAVRVATTGDDQGVEVSGPAAGVEAVTAALSDLAVDTLSWSEPAARDAVFAGRVPETVRGGAVVDLGAAGEGYLPFGDVEDRIDDGDVALVRVREPAAPWRDDRPVVTTDLRVSGALATLERGVDALVAHAPREAEELASMTELLTTDVPAAWGVRWERAAADAEMDALDEALETVGERARAVEDAVAAPASEDAPARRAAPLATRWLWFGRETRAACDDLRAAQAPTMPGHHRTKAAGGASDAVDFAERLGSLPAAFPFDAVTATFGPREGDEVPIHHGKPDGRVLTLGRATVTERDPATETVTLRREMRGGGTYDALDVEKVAGDVAVTKVREGRWWYPTTYRSAGGDVRGTYVNVCTPVEVFPDAVRYVDLHVDVVRHADGTVEVVDRAELAAAEESGSVPAALAERARSVAETVASGLR